MRRAILVVLAILVALPALGLLWLFLAFDADAWRPRVEEAVSQAVGRRFTAGRLRVSPGLVPAVAMDDIRLGNLPGGSRPEMLLLRRAEGRLALLPLLAGRAEIRSLVLEGGDLVLENGNWNLGPAPGAPAPAPADPAAAPPTASRGVRPDIRAVELRDWVITAAGERLGIPRANLASAGPGRAFTLAGTLVARGTAMQVEGGGGPEDARAGVALPGARLTLQARRAGDGWSGAAEAVAERLEALSTLAGRPLPPLRDVAVRAEGTLAGSAFRLSNGEASATGEVFPGLVLDEARIAMATLDGPAQLAARGRLRDLPFTATGEAAPAALLAGSPTPVALRAALADGEATVAGTWPGALDVALRQPELAPVAAAFGLALPPLREVALRARVERRGDDAVALDGLDLASSAGDLRGDVVLGWAPRPSVRGRVEARRLDFDALRPAAAPADPSPGAAPPPPAEGAARLVPDRPVDLAALRGFDTDLRFVVEELRWGGTSYREASGHLANEAGRARLDPVAVTLPAGRVEGRLAADATASPPALQVAGGGRALDLAALLGGGAVAGRGELDLNLRGQGASMRALAGTATGHLGLASLDARLAGDVAAAIGRAVPGMGGAVPLSCVAMRWALDRGTARTEVFLLEGALGRAGGEGRVNLADETVEARLSVDLRVAGVRVRAPIPVTGTLLAPRLEGRGLMEGALAGEVGNQLERLLPGIGRALPEAAGPAIPACGPALRLARGGRDGPVPAPPPAPDAPRLPEGVPPVLNELLRGLLR